MNSNQNKKPRRQQILEAFVQMLESSPGARITTAGGVEQAGVFAAEFDFDIRELVQGRFAFDKIAFDNLHFNIAKEGDAWFFAGLPMTEWFALGRQYDIAIRRFEAVKTDICTNERQQCLRVEDINVGRIQWQRSDNSWRISHAAPLLIDKAFLQDRSNVSSVLYLEALHIQQSQFSDTATAITDLNLKNFQLVEKLSQVGGKEVTPYQAQLGELSLKQLDLHFVPPRGVKISGVKLVSFRQSIQRQDGAAGNWLRRLRSWFPGVSGLWSDIDFSTQGEVSLQVTDFEMQGSKLTWRDDSVSPPVIEQLSQIKLQVNSIDSAKTDKSHIRVDAKLGEIGAIKIDSQAQFFAGAPLFDLTGFAHGVDLANFAGYSHKVFNQRVKAGVVDVSFNVGASQGQAAGQSSWRITGLATEAQNAPMNTAFKKLADHNNSVEFELPIGIDIGVDSNPMAALGRALNNTLINKASGIAKPTALQERKVSLESFPPVFFAANQVEPAALDLPRIPAIVARVKESPQAKLLVCPVATAGEWAELFNGGKPPSGNKAPTSDQKQKLIELTASRGQTLSRLLMNEGLNPARIILCGPSVDMSISGPSRASMAI